MAKLGINTGSTPNDGTGDTLLAAALKINQNFTEIYTTLGDGANLSGVVTSLVGYATEGYVDSSVVGFVTSGALSGYATEGYVDNVISGIGTGIVGEIILGVSPTWRGTSGITVSRQASGNYRVSFASTYTNNNDYYVLSQGMDQGFASYVGIARSTTHVDISINRIDNDVTIDSGSLVVQIKNHI